MNVLFLIPNLSAGGAERVLTRLANYWSEREHLVSVLTLDHPQQKPFYPLHPRVRLVQLDLALSKRRRSSKLIGLVRQVSAVRKHIVREQPEVVIAFLDIAIFLSLMSTIALPPRVIVSERNNPYRNRTNPWLQRMNNRLYTRADRIVLQTHRIAQTFPSSLQPSIRVIGNPVQQPNAQVEDYEAQLHKKTVVAIGRLTFQKGFDVLIRAFARLVHADPAWHLRLVGGGEEQATLAQLSADLSIADRVEFPGTVENVEAELFGASLFVLSSRFEGFPNALCEAMAMGLPVVATRCAFGPEEIIQHEVNGLLVPVDDVEALYDALRRLAANITLSKRLGTEAKKILRTNGTEIILSQWEAVVRQVIEQA